MRGFHQSIVINKMNKSENMFIPDDFNIPDHLATGQFCFVVLEESLTAIDYEAVMSSKERLRHIFSDSDDWPADDMSIDLNRSDLIEHENEFNAREAFAYGVLSPSKDRYIGCVYINPTKADGYDCEVYLWVRDSEVQLDNDLFKSTDNWLKAEWPFKQPAYPGRALAWDDWNELERKNKNERSRPEALTGRVEV